MPYKSLAEYKSSAKYFKANEFELAWWQHLNDLSKPTILFIHGFPSASWDWHYQWHALKGDYNLIAMDMLGYGLSDKPVPYHYTLVEQAKFYAQLLDSLGVNQCHVLAHDYGDSAAQELLHLVHTEQAKFTFQSVTFLNGGLFSESHRPLLTQKLLKSPLGPLVANFLSQTSLEKSFAKIFGPDTQPDKKEIEVLWQLLEYKQGTKAMPHLIQYINERKLRREDWLNAMQKTNIPMHFINGAFDPISGEHMRQRFAELLPESKTTSLKVGHYPQLEAPEAVLEQFRTFIET